MSAFDAHDAAPLTVPVSIGVNTSVGGTVTDMDGSGVRDVVVGHESGSSIYLADGTGGVGPEILTVDDDIHWVETMDVNGMASSVVGLEHISDATVHRGTGTGTLTCRRDIDIRPGGFNSSESAGARGGRVRWFR